MTDEVHTGLDIAFCFDGIQFILDIEQGGAAASDDTFFDSCAGRIQSIFDAESLILHFYFGSSTDFDDSNAAGHLCQTFLQFVFVELGSRFFVLFTDLSHSGCDLVFITCAADDGGVVFGDADLVSGAEII